MKTILSAVLLCIFANFNSYAQSQTGNVVLIEEFTETGCGACSQYDSAFQALTNFNADKVTVLNYHCFYQLDTFYTYNRSCDSRYSFYQITDGYPTVMVNGKRPGGGKSAHMARVNQQVINTTYNVPPQFKLEISSEATDKNNPHSISIKVKATSLINNPSKDLKVFVAVTENNINYFERYHAKTPNGIEKFNHIIRAMLPDTGATAIGVQKIGKVNQIKVSYINDDKAIDFKEVRLVAFVQDMNTREILGTVVTTENPFK